MMDSVTNYFSEFSAQQLQQLEALQGLYAEWNAKINVISRKDMDHFYQHHVLHSLSIAARFELMPGMEIMDLGCGGGFPGIPLAIFFPGVQFHLVDSINKKLKVVSAVAASLGLTNVTVAHTRAEDIRNRKFDTVVSRAVAPLKELWHWSRPLIRKHSIREEGLFIPNGLICLKGGDLSQEISESACKPMVWEIEKLFPEPYFQDKYLLYVPVR